MTKRDLRPNLWKLGGISVTLLSQTTADIDRIFSPPTLVGRDSQRLAPSKLGNVVNIRLQAHPVHLKITGLTPQTFNSYLI